MSLLCHFHVDLRLAQSTKRERWREALHIQIASVITIIFDIIHPKHLSFSFSQSFMLELAL